MDRIRITRDEYFQMQQDVALAPGVDYWCVPISIGEHMWGDYNYYRLGDEACRTKGKSAQVEQLRVCIDFINKSFPAHESLKWKRSRDCISKKFPKPVVRYLAANADAVQKIFYNSSANSYRFYAPVGFELLINKILSGYQELDQALPEKLAGAKKRIHKI